MCLDLSFFTNIILQLLCLNKRRLIKVFLSTQVDVIPSWPKLTNTAFSPDELFFDHRLRIVIDIPYGSEKYSKFYSWDEMDPKRIENMSMLHLTWNYGKQQWKACYDRKRNEGQDIDINDEVMVYDLRDLKNTQN